MISDLSTIVDTSCVPETYNVSLLQRSQYEWLLFAVRHFCDLFTDESSRSRVARKSRRTKTDTTTSE